MGPTRTIMASMAGLILALGLGAPARAADLGLGLAAAG